MEDDESLVLKAQSAPQRNEDSDTENLKTDCCMCPPVGIEVKLVVSNHMDGDLLRLMLKRHLIKREKRNVMFK